MRGLLGVVINDGQADRDVTDFVSDLRFAETAPGGHHSLNLRVALPRSTFPNLGPADKVTVYDIRTGLKVWEGYIENPGATDSEGVEGFDLMAMGGQVLASDQTQQLIYIDYSFEGWERAEDFGSAASASTEVSTRPTDALQCLLCQFNPGQPITTNSRARLWYRAIENAGMQIGAVTFTTLSGVTDANYAMQVSIRAADASNIATVVNRTAATFSVAHHFVAPTDFAHGGSYMTAQFTRSAGGATNVANDDTWAAFASLRIAGARKDRYGNYVTMRGAYNVYAHEVAEDLLGRLLINVCDGSTATIDSSTYPITHLAFKDGANAQQVFDALALYEPDMLWEILETNASGKHRFNYRAWPTEPRYEISTRDGYEAPGGDVDLCNRIAVSFVDSKAKPQTVVVTASVPELGTRTRDAEAVRIDGVSTEADAQRIGEQVLAAKNNPPKAARATVTGPILDRLTGNMVMPWEIRAGYIVRVRETGDDLRCTEREYVDSDHAAYLTLGEPMLTIDQRLAALGARR